MAGAHNYAHDDGRRPELVSGSPFVAWAELRGVHPAPDVTLPVLEAYQRHVSLRRKSDGMPLSWSTQSRCLVALRVFFAWCTKTSASLSNPASELVMPRQPHKLPRPR